MKKRIYLFKEGDPGNKALLGGKGAGLARMTQLGIPTPEGFTITTEQCVQFLENGMQWPEGLLDEMFDTIRWLEQETGKTFGGNSEPLILAVRSGAAESYPGTMDTILNVGLNSKTVRVLAKETNNYRFAYDSYRRLILMYSSSVFGLSSKKFEEVLSDEKDREGVTEDYQLSVGGLKNVIKGYMAILKKADRVFPQSVTEQLIGAAESVFRSWNNPEAITLRAYEGVKPSDKLGTAVNTQRMVFGNKGNTSGTGVVLSRNADTGENVLYGEWLLNAQGEDVVAGIRTPQPLSKTADSNGQSLEEMMKDVYDELVGYCRLLEEQYNDMVDIEFTIENGKLYLLQSRQGKRSGAAAVRIAVEKVADGSLTKHEAITRISEEKINQVLHSVLKPGSSKSLAKGIAAGPGGAVGKAVFSADDAVLWKERGEPVILVRALTTPEDIHGMIAAEGILTSCGGKTSHAALVGRGMGKPCVVGCQDISVDEANKLFTVGVETVREGEWISFDGSTGKVYKGKLEKADPVMTDEFRTLLEWCREIATMKVYANADTPKDALVAKGFGAVGIGLTRFEHMAFDPKQLPIMQNLILHIEDPEKRRENLALLEEHFYNDFKEMFDVFSGLPVTVRKLDPPLHEFLPDDKALAKMNLDEATMQTWKDTRAKLHEHNPMMGFRGLRIGYVYPDIYEGMLRPLFRAACDAKNACLEVMIPLVALTEEFISLRKMVDTIATEVMEERGVVISYKVGTMIETPAAALAADELVEHADFFSFGTNDLTQLTYGFSRDDSARFLPTYVDNGILKKDVFESIHRGGAGKLMRYATHKSREVKPDFKVGICGEHGGDPDSIAFCNELGLTYVSCSPYRVPVAWLAAAQAAIKTMEMVSEEA